MKGGQAIAEIILGETEPSGRLPITFPRHAGPTAGLLQPDPWPARQPVRRSHAGSGIRVRRGSRLHDLRIWQATITNAPTSGTFTTDDTVHAEITLTNTGERKGTEVAQLYIGDIVTSYSWTGPRAQGVPARGA